MAHASMHMDSFGNICNLQGAHSPIRISVFPSFEGTAEFSASSGRRSVPSASGAEPLPVGCRSVQAERYILRSSACQQDWTVIAP